MHLSNTGIVVCNIEMDTEYEWCICTVIHYENEHGQLSLLTLWSTTRAGLEAHQLTNIVVNYCAHTPALLMATWSYADIDVESYS